MRADEFKLADLQKLLADKLPLTEWTQEIVSQTLQTHALLLKSPAAATEKNTTLTQELGQQVRHLVHTRLLHRINQEMSAVEFLPTELLVTICAEVESLLQHIPLPLNIKVRLSTVLRISPLSAVLFTLIVGLIGLLLGAQLRLPEAGMLSGSLLAAWALAQLHNRLVRQPPIAGPMRYLVNWLGNPATNVTGLAEELECEVTQALETLSQLVIILFWSSGYVKLQARAAQQGNTDQLESFLQNCSTALAEIFFSEQLRDAERALDACIKLCTDLQAAGLSARTLEPGTPYTPELAEIFEIFGRANSGDPLFMIQPAWFFRDKLIIKGRAKRRS